VDDEPLAVKLMESNVGLVDFLQLKASFSDAATASRFLEKNQVDLVFLDIQMPGINGMDLAKKLDGPLIIFTTAFEHYAVQVFEVNAVDYLLKPITLKRFRAACEKAKELLQWKLFFSDIKYVEGLKDYVKIHLLSDPKPVLTRTNLRGIGEQLPKQFLRVHKSYIVNMDHVKSCDKDTILLKTASVSLGAAYKTSFLEKLRH
jgi:DNA-binding LytR/AlgR family response regulator